MSSFATSKEGYIWSPEKGLQAGLATEGAIRPLSSFAAAQSSKPFDTIVIGAGYAGLTAARDLTLAGQKVLLLEARDRIGGRTWTAQVDGEKYEMGGTWVHWTMGYIWREITRYGLERKLKITPNELYPDYAFNRTNFNGTIFTESFKPNFEMCENAFKRFVDVDGQLGATVVAIPTQVMDGPLVNPELVEKYDRMSIADRIAEVRAKNICSERELAYLIPWFVLSWGARPENASMLELIKWARHGENSFGMLASILWFYKFADGQSHFAKSFFDEAFESGNLCYSLETVVTKVEDRHGSVEVFTNKGSYKAAKVVCTLPSNVAAKVQFSPPLSPLRQEAFSQKHVGQGHKIHSLFSKPEFRSGVWNAWNEPGHGETLELAAAFGDQTLKDGRVSVVSFGGGNSAQNVPSQDPTKIKRWLTQVDPELEQPYLGSIWHEWIADPYAEGHWCMWGPGHYTKYFRELQKPHGNIEWASADWADGWKSFIDGAIEQGGKAAYRITKEWRRRPQQSRL
ncbi:flavin monoamine oxidase family protein [Rhodotorula paludigena]|uniref:flavin monoamine oxidase family protein n=1 Tax=Rhodotorula paludigena TaxID=86838 RepID=UPI003175EE12